MPDSPQPEVIPPLDAEQVGTLPNPSVSFGTVPHGAESFRIVPNSSASFRTLPKHAERTASHTLTVREVARLFEAAGVSRTERSIVKWCLPNKHDVARLDAFFDANERKWFITPESVDRAIAEEKARAVRHQEPLPHSSDEHVPHPSESRTKRESSIPSDVEEITDLNARLRDLEITNRVKDAVIKKLETDLHSADEERKGYIQQLIQKSHQIGSLETQLLQIDAPRNAPALPNGGEHTDAGKPTLTD